MPQVLFHHDRIGSLVIDNGLDGAQWGYNLNTANFPTYGGEVVQILSVYIDDLTLTGPCTTYVQMEAIYSYFSTYLQIATQGRSPQAPTDNTTGPSYNLSPVSFSYPTRNWNFNLYPKAIPGFRYGREVVNPIWMMSAHVIDDSPDLALIKDGLKALATQQMQNGESLTLNGEISPHEGNPDTNPFQTYTSSFNSQQQIISDYGDYYQSLIPAYAQGDFSALTSGLGSTPNFGLAGPAGQAKAAASNTVYLPKP